MREKTNLYKNTVERCFLRDSVSIDVSIIFDVVHFASDLFKQILSCPRLCIPDERKKKCIKCLSSFHR